MPLMELVLRSTIDGQQQINRWNYLASGTPAAVSLSFGLVYAFGAVDTLGVLPPDGLFNLILSELTNNVVFLEVEARDLYSPTDFYVRPFPAGLTGGITSESLPPFASFGFRTNRVRTDIARGTKRFSGVSENLVGDGGLLTSAAITELQAIADAMSAPLTYDDEGNTLTFVPVILGREDYVTPSGRKAYKLYATEAEQLEHVASGILWSPYTTVRSQVSRQYGRGR